MRSFLLTLIVSLSISLPAYAAEIEGRVADLSGGVLAGALVRLQTVATGEAVTSTTDSSGRYRFGDLKVGIYRVVASQAGFSEASRAVVIDDASKTITVDFDLELGAFKAEVTVSADRGERDVQLVPLRTDAVDAISIREQAPVSTGDALVN